MVKGALGAVEAWQMAVNDGAAEAASALTAEQVVVLGPRGEGSMRGRALGGWMVRSGFTAIPLRWFCGGDGNVVVEQAARWVDTQTGHEQGRAVVATHFEVKNNLVNRIARHDDGLETALRSAGLNPTDEVGR